MSGNKNFWEVTPLSDMTSTEWESLCDGCGKCCLHKLEDEDTGELAYTDIACELLCLETSQCKDYSNRKQKVPECLLLTPETVGEYEWLPSTCAYRLVSEGKPLARWHPLVSGEPSSIHSAGISVAGRVLSAAHIHPDDYEERIVNWVK